MYKSKAVKSYLISVDRSNNLIIKGQGAPVEMEHRSGLINNETINNTNTIEISCIYALNNTY